MEPRAEENIRLKETRAASMLERKNQTKNLSFRRTSSYTSILPSTFSIELHQLLQDRQGLWTQKKNWESSVKNLLASPTKKTPRSQDPVSTVKPDTNSILDEEPGECEQQLLHAPDLTKKVVSTKQITLSDIHIYIIAWLRGCGASAFVGSPDEKPWSGTSDPRHPTGAQQLLGALHQPALAALPSPSVTAL